MLDRVERTFADHLLKDHPNRLDNYVQGVSVTSIVTALGRRYPAGFRWLTANLAGLFPLLLLGMPVRKKQYSRMHSKDTRKAFGSFDSQRNTIVFDG